MPWKSPEARARYQRVYNATPEQKRRRAAQNAARREYEKKHGDLPSDVHVDHRTALDQGGGNEMSNLRAISAHANLGYPRDKRGQPTGPARGRDYGKAKK